MNRKLKNEELNRLKVDEFKASKKRPIKVILEDIRSMSNVGSVFRTSDAFLVDQIVLCGITGKPPHREIQRTALGATDSVSWVYEEKTLDAVRECKAKGYKVFAIEQSSHSVSLNDWSIDGAIAVVFGNEVNGVSQKVIDLCDGVVEIPQDGTKHSLNVSVTAGIVLWELRNKLNKR